MIDGIQTVRIVAVQRRKHRKRRINKKWEKKYGLRYYEVINCDIFEIKGKPYCISAIISPKK